MSDTVWLHPMKIDIRPYPWWERFRVGLSVLVFGVATFRGQMTDAKEEDLPQLDRK